MNLYNTKTKKVEEFIPNGDEVKIYTCGPTVYHFAHIGNLRTYIMEDVLEKSLNYVGYKTKRCMNITDVGHIVGDADTGKDKMLEGASREHKTVMEIAKMYTDAFFKDLEKLNIKKPEIIVPATSCVEDYIKMIEELITKGYAYISDGNVYFDTSKVNSYYTLTSQDNNEMLVGAREDVLEDAAKKNKTDFVLWFTKSKFENQELKWNSPWGIGYPGWHIECSVIAIKYLGEYLDIHCGGVDNIFPHHTNEIAQSESYLGHKWCNFWFHSEYLNDATGKMSKSKGEFLILSLLEEKGYNPLAYRLFCLGSHYRKQLVFTYESLDVAQNTYDKLINKIKLLTDKTTVNQKIIEEFNNKFKEALNDDLNTSKALTVLYEVVNSNIADSEKLHLIKEFDKVLGLNLIQNNNIDEELKNYIEEKLDERKKAKQENNYVLADEIRKELEKKGIYIKDTKEGTTYFIR